MGTLDDDYFYEIDDPYKVLAHYIVGFYRPSDVLRILTDLGGHFVDCVIEGILADKDRMEYMHELDRLGAYYFSRLDKERLRDEILAVLNEAGISLG